MEIHSELLYLVNTQIDVVSYNLLKALRKKKKAAPVAAETPEKAVDSRVRWSQHPGRPVLRVKGGGAVAAPVTLLA